MSERNITYAEAIREALSIEMRNDPKVFILGEDVGKFGGCFGVTKGMLDEFGPERVRDTPISEAAILGLSLGAAQMGLRPVPEIMFGDFLAECFDNLYNQAAKVRFMCGGQIQKLPYVIRSTVGGWIRAAGQHSQSVEGFFTQIPGLKVVMPAFPDDAKGLMLAALRENDPVLFLEHKVLYGAEGPVPEGDYVVPIGKAKVRKAGKDITVVASALMVHKALAAAGVLAKEGIDIEVIDLRTVSHLDKETICESVKKTHRAVVVQEAPSRGGTNAQVIALIVENAFNWLEAPIRQVAALDTIIPFSPPLEDMVLPDEGKIVATVKEVMSA
jgi:acetoin:2,6-dichlorophenolindophenol oxidoreductase subunit beta